MAFSDIQWLALLTAVLLFNLQCLNNSFVQACGGNFTGSSGVITSPSYPQSYQSNLRCVYTITQSQGLPIALIFEDFDTEGCSYDYVEIRDGNSDSSSLLTPRLCGSVLPPVLCSTQRYMRLLFRTDGSIERKGFRATYSVCGGIFTTSSGIIQSPSYPNNYPNDIDYSYVIRQTDGYFIYLNFTDFFLEVSSNCIRDYVEIRNGGTFKSPLLGSRLCGTSLPPVQRTTQNLMWIRFKTDGSLVYKGFQASYTNCGGRFTSSSGVLTSPSYPSNYPNNMDCTYVISQSSGYFIALIFTVFQLRSSVNCTIDFIEIRNASTQSSTQMGSRFCGSIFPPVFTSSQGSMSIRFRSDGSGVYRGFQASYTTCGGIYTSAQGYIQSPSYQSTYHSNMDCVYVISMPAGYHINISFNTFILQGGGNCLNNYVEIRDSGSQTSPILGQRLCGKTIPPTQTTSQNLAWIHFKSDNSTNYQGFQLSYTSSCASVFTAQKSTISSPSTTVNNHLSGKECIYVITQPQGHRVTLNFTRFDTASGINCVSDFVEVLDGESASSPILGSRFCGVTLPPVQRSTQNTMSIRFKIELSSSNKGFQAIYTSEVIPQEIFLMTDDVSVIHMDLETRSYSHISTTRMRQPMGVDYDPGEDRVYWTDIARGEICSSRLNNTNFRMMHFLGKNSQPYGIAVDTVSRLIFYTEARKNTIGLLTISNLSHKLLVNTDLDEPKAITLDKLNGLIFWSQVGSTPKIERANYDASDRKTLVATSIKYPSAIAVVVESNQLFWIDPGADTLECADLEGRNRRLIYRSPDRHFVGMALFGNHLYLTDWGQLGPNSTRSYVRRMDKNGHNDIIFATFPGHLHNIHIYSERSQHPGTSTCSRNNGNCSRICIPAPNNATMCMCPDGESLSLDRKECFPGGIIESDSSAGTRIVIGAVSGGAVLILIIIASLIGVVIFKRRKGGQRTDNQCGNLQMRESTYDGPNLFETRALSAQMELDQYDIMAEKHQIDNPTYMNIDNIYANQFVVEPIYVNNEAMA